MIEDRSPPGRKDDDHALPFPPPAGSSRCLSNLLSAIYGLLTPFYGVVAAALMFARQAERLWQDTKDGIGGSRAWKTVRFSDTLCCMDWEVCWCRPAASCWC